MIVLLFALSSSEAADWPKVHAQVSGTSQCDGSRGCMLATVRFTTESCSDGSMDFQIRWNDGEVDKDTIRLSRAGTGTKQFGSLNPGSLARPRLIEEIRWTAHCNGMRAFSAGDLGVRG